MNIENILQKLRFKDGLKSIIINAPKQIEEEFKKIGMAGSAKKSEKYQFTILFVRDKSEVQKLAKSTIDNAEYDSVFWIAYPKGGSSIKSDINRDKLWELLKPYEYRPVSQVAIDNDWSALRFRPIEKVKSKS